MNPFTVKVPPEAGADSLLWCRRCFRIAKWTGKAWRSFGTVSKRHGHQKGECTGCESGDGRTFGDALRDGKP